MARGGTEMAAGLVRAVLEVISTTRCVQQDLFSRLNLGAMDDECSQGPAVPITLVVARPANRNFNARQHHPLLTVRLPDRRILAARSAVCQNADRIARRNLERARCLKAAPKIPP